MFLIRQGGIFMAPLLISSILMLAIIAERLHVFAGIIKKPLIEYSNPEEIVMKLRRRLVSLHTIIVISPMLGLLGTVTGLMKCFHLLGNKVSGFEPQEMSLGISEALLTTAAGLVIAVIATIFYNHFFSRLDEYVQRYNAALKKVEHHE